MIDIPLSVLAWISVVVIQAIVHYVILVPRQVMAGEEDVKDIGLEESPSLASTDGTEELDASFSKEYQYNVISVAPGTPPHYVEKEVGPEEPEQLLEFLGQSGTDFVKRRSVKCIVEEQIRATEILAQ